MVHSINRLNDREMSTENPKRALYAQFAAVAKALAHANRLELLELVAQGEGSVESLAQRCGLSVANASQHLHQLRRAGLVATRRENKFVFYRLADDTVLAALSLLRRVAERNLAEVDQLIRSYFLRRDNLEPITRGELEERMRKGLVTVLDVRPPEEFRLGHVPGAQNVPLTELKRVLARLERKSEVIAYCRGPYCILAFEAVAQLRAAGFKARRLEDGFPEWRAAALPVQTGTAS
jgi:rhodanese-related sulfurtransferase/DNA-binding transcriptional ArsR family regulator